MLGEGASDVVTEALGLETRFKSKEDFSHKIPSEKCKMGVIGGDPNNANYGAWPICTNLVPNKAIVYSFGIGGDVTFDIGMVNDYDATLFCYDPTVKPGNTHFTIL